MCGSKPTVNILIGATIKTPYPPVITDGVNISTTEEGDENFTTLVSSGTTIIFKKTGDISDITTIAYSGESELFSTLPSQQSDGSWKGVIGSFPVNTEETYSISYVVNKQVYTQDPKIRLNQ
ncbi:MAG: hypothetical protein WAU01_12260 [Saprospiraceae bacterium]